MIQMMTDHVVLYICHFAVDIDTVRTVSRAINVEVVVQLLYDSTSSETVIWTRDSQQYGYPRQTTPAFS